MSLLIKNADLIVTMDEMRRSIREGSIAIEDDRIVDLGPASDLQGGYPNADKVIDAKGMVAFPGLINSHTHLLQTIVRGLADDHDLAEWLEPIYLLRREASREEVFLSSMLGCLEMIRNGITTFADLQSSSHIDDAVRAILQSGLRSVIARISTDYKEVDTTPVESIEMSTRANEAFIRRWHNHVSGRIQVMLGPLGLPASSEELFVKTKELSRKYGVGVHTHAGENKKTLSELRKRYRKSEIGVLNDLGILGPNVLLAHCVLVSDSDIELLRMTKSNVVHCPSSNMKLGTGIAPIPKMIGCGINVALGTDGAASNNRIDMITEMKQAALLHKVGSLSSKAFQAEQALEMATIGGAKALGLQKTVGSIEREKKADLILVSFRKPHLLPNWDSISQLVYSATGCDVETVICNGQVLMEERKLVTLDETHILEKARSVKESIQERLPSLKRYLRN